MQLIRDIMNKDVKTVAPNAPLTEVARLMRDQEIGILPVWDGNKLLGMISDRDIITRVLAENKDPGRTQVSEVMTRNVFYCFENQNVAEAAAIMRKVQTRRIVILDQKKSLSGILSLDDLANLGGRSHLVGKTLRKISVPISIFSGFAQLQKKSGRRIGLLTLGFSIIGLGVYLSYFRQLRIS